MNSNKKNKKKYVSKADLAEFFLLYDEEYYSLRRRNVYIWIVFLLFQFLLILINAWYSLIILIIFSILVIIISSKKRINFKNYDEEDFINYIDTPGSKRKNSFKELVEKIEKVRGEYLKVIRNSRKTVAIIYEILIFILNFISLVLLIFFIFIFVLLAFYGVTIQFSLEINILYLISYIIVGLFVLFYNSKLLDYSNVYRCSELFRFWVEGKLIDISVELDLFKRSKNSEISIEKFNLYLILQEWYEYYCCRYSSNEEVNNIISQYHDLIFAPSDEHYYLEIFSEVRGRLKDHIYFLSFQGDERTNDLEKWEEILSLIDNYISILKSSIDRVSLIKREKFERRKSWEAILSLILSPITIGISVFALIISLMK